MAPSVNMAVDLSGSGAVGVLFYDALGLAAVQLLKDPVDVESHIGDRPAESPALDQDGSWTGAGGWRRRTTAPAPFCAGGMR